MIDKYDNLAKESGARIVHFCGHDCIPWDLTGKPSYNLEAILLSQTNSCKSNSAGMFEEVTRSR
jgi:short subunit dehydrogenase-like uncharacterized protein